MKNEYSIENEVPNLLKKDLNLNKKLTSTYASKKRS